MKSKLYAAFIVASGIACGSLHAQTNTFPTNGSVGIGTITPDPSAKLDITATSKGLLIPRLTQSQRTSIASPAIGLMVYQKSPNPGFYFYDGTDWTNVAYWRRNTNNGSLFYTGGNVGIGTSSPNVKLNVSGGRFVQLASGGYVVIGDTTSSNIAIDYNVIQARNNGSASSIWLNYYGGTTYLGPSAALQVTGSGTTLTAGNFNFSSGTQSIQFANPGTTPAPMMYMFSSGTSNTTRMVIAHSPSFPTWGLQYTDAGDQFDFLGAGTSRMSINLSNGNVGIGVTSPIYKLEVCGTIRAKEVRVETGWCDYVFEKNYKLRTIDDLEQYIDQNKHLPGIAPASDVEENGLKVGEMNKAMMEKIEELTLYVIQLSKDNKKLQEEIDTLKK